VIKNPSPAYIAVFGGLLVLLLSVVLGLALGGDLNTMIVLGLALAVLSAVAFYFLIQFFIQRKIDLIYKNIYRFRTQDKTLWSRLSQPGQDPIKELSTDVLSWMQSNKKEILELKAQARFRREFMGNVSHELKTPIFSIQGYIHTLLDGALEDPEVNQKFLRKAAKAVDRLTELVDDLTEISTLQSGKVELVIEKVDLAELCDEVYDMVDSKAKEKKVICSYTKTGVRSNLVNADKRQIMQVLTNLVVNGIKYGKEGGKVEVSSHSIGDHILVEVKDDGEGIAEEHLPRLFERFYRVDEHRNREDGGSGLGLSIVKHIIESHGQTIDVRSSIGQGTVFSFSLEKA
jgi:two-component system phosphate regulon sensor histidine kinase PhoR